MLHVGHRFDVFSLQFLPSLAELRSISPAEVSMVRCFEEGRFEAGLYQIIKTKNENRMTRMEFHEDTLKFFDEEMKSTSIPRPLSQKELDYLLTTLRKVDFKMVFKALYDRCYPHEAACLSLGVVPHKIVYYCTLTKNFKFGDKEVRDRTLALCDHDTSKFENYHLPLCAHVEKLLANPACDIDRMLLVLMEEMVFYKDEQEEVVNQYSRLAEKLGLCTHDENAGKKFSNASEIGRKGNKERNEPHEKAKLMAVRFCRNLLNNSEYDDLKSHQIIKMAIKYLTAEKFFNPYKKQRGKKQPYTFNTIKSWINHLIPSDRKTVGSPKKEIPYRIVSIGQPSAREPIF